MRESHEAYGTTEERRVAEDINAQCCALINSVRGQQGATQQGVLLAVGAIVCNFLLALSPVMRLVCAQWLHNVIERTVDDISASQENTNTEKE